MTAMTTKTRAFLLAIIISIFGTAAIPTNGAAADTPASTRSGAITHHEVTSKAPEPANAASHITPRPMSYIESSGPWYKKNYTIYLNRSETNLLATASTKLIDLLPVPWLVKQALKGYAWLLQSTARNAYSSGRCALLYTTAYAGWTSPPGAAPYVGSHCN